MNDFESFLDFEGFLEEALQGYMRKEVNYLRITTDALLKSSFLKNTPLPGGHPVNEWLRISLAHLSNSTVPLMQFCGRFPTDILKIVKNIEDYKNNDSGNDSGNDSDNDSSSDYESDPSNNSNDQGNLIDFHSILAEQLTRILALHSSSIFSKSTLALMPVSFPTPGNIKPDIEVYDTDEAVQTLWSCLIEPLSDRQTERFFLLSNEYCALLNDLRDKNNQLIADCELLGITEKMLNTITSEYQAIHKSMTESYKAVGIVRDNILEIEIPELLPIPEKPSIEIEAELGPAEFDLVSSKNTWTPLTTSLATQTLSDSVEHKELEPNPPESGSDSKLKRQQP